MELAEKAIVVNHDANLSLMFTYKDAFYRRMLEPFLFDKELSLL
ncbi:hypothetical protein [Sporosarcina sp. E16_8]|nr:hypothetical protein [Sporosarcina sp. E16_8]